MFYQGEAESYVKLPTVTVAFLLKTNFFSFKVSKSFVTSSVFLATSIFIDTIDISGSLGRPIIRRK